jgi:hypothetical protein
LSHRPETSAKKEGKECVKFVDGLANVAENIPGGHNAVRGFLVESLQLGYSRAATDTDPELGCTGSADPYDLLAEVLAVQQPQKRFRHAFDPLKYILFERRSAGKEGLTR